MPPKEWQYSSFSKFVKSDYYNIDWCNLEDINEIIKTILNSATSELYFSMDNMMKNKLTHPKVINEDYKKILK